MGGWVGGWVVVMLVMIVVMKSHHHNSADQVAGACVVRDMNAVDRVEGHERQNSASYLFPVDQKLLSMARVAQIRVAPDSLSARDPKTSYNLGAKAQALIHSRSATAGNSAAEAAAKRALHEFRRCCRGMLGRPLGALLEY